jgi:hypothetical protein
MPVADEVISVHKPWPLDAPYLSLGRWAHSDFAAAVAIGRV